MIVIKANSNFILDHVKVLLCRTFQFEKDVLEKNLTEATLPFTSIEEVQVPIRYPITKQQYEKWNLLWPLVFHESTYER